MLSLIPWGRTFPARERYDCYVSNKCFVECINDNGQYDQLFAIKTIEYGYLYDEQAEYDANHTHPNNEFMSTSWNPAVSLNYCSWKTLRAIIEGHPMTITILLAIQPNIIRKLYSSLSNEQKLVAKKSYDKLTDPVRHYNIRNIPVPYFTIAKYLQYVMDN